MITSQEKWSPVDSDESTDGDSAALITTHLSYVKCGNVDIWAMPDTWSWLISTS